MAFLSEAKRLDGNVLPGYKNAAAPARMGDDHDNCRLLIRRAGTTFIAEGAVKVPGPMWQWKDNRKPTRVIPWEAFARFGQVYVAISIHRIPMGPVPGNAVNRAGWAAEHRAIVSLVRELRRRFPEAVIILGGDWNAGWNERPEVPFSLRSLARDLGEAVDAAVFHIDGVLVLGGKVRGGERLDNKFGSDAHYPVLGQVVAT